MPRSLTQYAQATFIYFLPAAGAVAISPYPKHTALGLLFASILLTWRNNRAYRGNNPDQMLDTCRNIGIILGCTLGLWIAGAIPQPSESKHNFSA